MEDYHHSHVYHKTPETVAVIAFSVVFEGAICAVSGFSEGGFRGEEAAFHGSSGVFVLVGGERLNKQSFGYNRIYNLISVNTLLNYHTRPNQSYLKNDPKCIWLI